MGNSVVQLIETLLDATGDWSIGGGKERGEDCVWRGRNQEDALSHLERVELYGRLKRAKSEYGTNPLGMGNCKNMSSSHSFERVGTLPTKPVAESAIESAAEHAIEHKYIRQSPPHWQRYFRNLSYLLIGFYLLMQSDNNLSEL